MGEAIRVRDLSVYYGRFRAVADVNVDIAANRVTALIGPSGTGKSSLLRALNRLHEVPAGRRVAGQVLLDGQDIYAPGVDTNRVRRLIGMIFQVPNPFPTMSVYENVVAGHLLAGEHLPRPTLDEIVETSLTRTNLWAEVKDRLSQPGRSLSGGQHQRLCIARAIAMRPQVLLMDEPASALDPISTYILEDLIQELAHAVTIVIVTHNMQQAARVSHTTAFLDLAGPGEPGRLIEVGSTDRIFTNPANPRTTDYITGRFG